MNIRHRIRLHLEYLYHCLCLVAAITLIGRCIHIYFLDEDLTWTSYKKFNKNKDSIYPSINICFGDIFIEEMLTLYETTTISYVQYLKGELHSHNLSQIPYEDVTIDPLDYLLAIKFFQAMTNKLGNPENNHFYDYTNENHRNVVKEALNVDPYNNAWGTFCKCLTFDVPFLENKRFNWIALVMKKSIFPDGKRPMSAKNRSYFSVSLSYPNQRLRYSREKENWNAEITNGSYGMTFQVASLEVMQFRNKKSEPCNPKWKEDDKEIRKTLISKVKCIPPYWKGEAKLDYKECSGTEMKQLYSVADWENDPKPCRIISQSLFPNSDFVHSGFDGMFESGYSGNYFIVYFNYPDKFYKEIKMVKAFDIETLIGNGGGYLGLCLGYSVLQLPTFAFSVYKNVRRNCKGNVLDEEDQGMA